MPLARRARCGSCGGARYVRIELVFDDSCPNVDAARANLSAALRALGIAWAWQEWRRDDHAAPAHARRAGSPAILVNGVDVEGHENAGDACCRVHVGADGRRTDAPPVETILAALRRAGLDLGGSSAPR